MRREDAGRIAEIRAQPEVARWWRALEVDEIAADLDDPELACWVVELDDRVIGFVQAYEETDEEFRHAGIDLFLDPAVGGRGLGRETLRRVVRHLFDDRGHHRVVIDPAEANTRAIRAFEAVGFRRVGVLRQYWWDHVEGRWANGVLLDLLRDELD